MKIIFQNILSNQRRQFSIQLLRKTFYMIQNIVVIVTGLVRQQKMKENIHSSGSISALITLSICFFSGFLTHPFQSFKVLDYFLLNWSNTK